MNKKTIVKTISKVMFWIIFYSGSLFWFIPRALNSVHQWKVMIGAMYMLILLFFTLYWIGIWSHKSLHKKKEEAC